VKLSAFKIFKTKKIMKLVYRCILPLLVLFAMTTFAQAPKKTDQKYVGTYKTEDQKSCPIALTITSKGDGYHYAIKIKNKVQEGRLKVSKIKDEVYLAFVGLVAKKPKYEVEGQYIDNAVVIQNEGNAMNKYTIFGACDAKYIELKKIGKNY
jgi:hypothetical protein